MINILLLIFTEGAGNLIKGETYAAKLWSLVKVITKETVSVVKGGISDLLAFLGKFIVKFVKACKNGWRSFIKWIEELLQGAKNGAKAEDFAEDAKDIEEVVLQGKKKGKHSSSNIEGEGLYGGKILSKAEIEDWAIILKKKFGTKLQKVENFDDPTVLAAFNPNTNTIKYKENVTEYFMTHESFHAEEMHLIGFDKYVENAHVEGTLWTIENRIHQYKREKYVYERLVENKERYKFNNEEVGIPPYGYAFQYYDYIKYKLEILLKKNNIPFPN